MFQDVCVQPVRAGIIEAGELKKKIMIDNTDNEERLQKALARAGIASRRACEELIATGRVKVNGKIVTQLGTKIDPAHDKILVDDHPVAVKLSSTPKKIYIALNKPEGYLSTVTDPQGRPTIMDLVESEERLYPVGRLDADTSGLLLLTNDGAFAHALTHPRFGVEKEYYALVDGRPPMKKLEDLRKGISIPVENPETGEQEEQMTKPARVELVGYEGSNTLLRFIIKEGKKRQVRLMARAIGFPVIELKRVRFGPLPLGDLAEGRTRALSKIEVKAMLQSANGERVSTQTGPGNARPRSFVKTTPHPNQAGQERPRQRTDKAPTAGVDREKYPSRTDRAPAASGRQERPGQRTGKAPAATDRQERLGQRSGKAPTTTDRPERSRTGKAPATTDRQERPRTGRAPATGGNQERERDRSGKAPVGGARQERPNNGKAPFRQTTPTNPRSKSPVRSEPRNAARPPQGRTTPSRTEPKPTAPNRGRPNTNKRG